MRAKQKAPQDEAGTPEKKERHSAAPIDPRLVRRAQATRTYMISGVVVGCLTAVLVLTQAKLLSRSISAVFATHTLDGLGLTLVLLVVVLVGRGVLAWASSWLAQRTSAAVKSQLRRDILAARLAAPAHQTSSSSSLVTLVTQGLDALDGYFSKYLPQLLLATTVPIIVGAAILFSDWRSALIIAATIPFIPILMALVGWTTEKQVSKRWAYQSRLASHFADLVSGLPTLQVFGRAKAQAEGLKRTENANRKATMSILRISFMSAFVLELFSTLAVAVIALVIGTRLVYDQMSFSTALFVLILAPEVYLPIRQVGVHYHDSADGLAAAEAAFAEIDRAAVPASEDTGDKADARGQQSFGGPGAKVLADPSSAAGQTRGPSIGAGDSGTSASAAGQIRGSMTGAGQAYVPSIRMRGLTYTYPDSDTALGPFDLDVNPGEIVALAGRSGGGKTTLLNCVLGFLIPNSPGNTSGAGVATGSLTGDGSPSQASSPGASFVQDKALVAEPAGPALLLSGLDAGQIDWATWRSGLAYVPQVPGMIDGTIADNVRLGCPQATDEQVRQVLIAAGAGNLDPARSVGEEGEGLSVGERRRVGIARALARIEIAGARLLILDEPTAGLDTDTEATVLGSLRESGATALVVSHREAVLDAADRVVHIFGHEPTDDSARDDLLSEVGSSAASATGASMNDGGVVVAGVLQDDRTGPTPTGAAVPDPTVASVTEADVSSLAAPTGSSGGDPVVASGTTAVVPTETTPVSDSAPHPALSNTPTGTDDPPEKQYKAKSPLLRLVFSLLDSVPGARSRLLLAILMAAFASGAAVSLMGVSAWLISKAAEHPPFLELSVAAVGVRFFGISRGVFRYVERLLGHDVALSMQSALRLKTYKALAKTTLLGRRQGDLLVRVVADVGAIEDIVVRIVQPFLAASLVVVGVCSILARFSIAAALAVLVSAIIGGLIVPWLTQRASLRSDEEAVPLRGELGAVVHDLSRNAIDLAAYGAEERSLARMGAVDMALRKAEEASAWAKGIGAGFQTVASGIGFIGGLWIGAVAVANGTMGERLLAVMVLAPLALHEVFSTFSQAAQTWTRARVALTRVADVLESPPIGHGDVDSRDASEEPSLHCEHLAIGWPGYPQVAGGLNLEVARGEAVGVMGPSGVGKTTLAATIMGLIPPVSGELSSTGRIGYLAQDAHIFTTTIAENVRIGNKDATDDQVREALAEAGLDMPLDREVGELGAGLSGGEARRLALARLFAGDYRLLILDEPTEHLDRDTADTLMDEIFSGVARRPVVVISHDESIAARCDRVLPMGPGRPSGVAE